jgi:low temperature requirement protein LtrA
VENENTTLIIILKLNYNFLFNLSFLHFQKKKKRQKLCKLIGFRTLSGLAQVYNQTVQLYVLLVNTSVYQAIANLNFSQGKKT